VSGVGEQAGGWRRWRDAMADALYGEDGFYRHSGAPAAHFRTSAHASPSWAGAIATLAGRAAERMPESAAFTVVEVGAGGGELLGGLAVRVPSEWRLVGVDVCPRPAGVPERVEWAEQLPASFDGVLIAVEWLDVVPVDVVERTDDGGRLVEVSADGAERLGAVADIDASQWLERWWPLAEVGDRAEIGSTRDDAWADACSHLRRGVAVAVDYAADPRRDVAGTLTGYRDGRQVLPVPDGSCDITAHVLMQSCAAAVTDADTRLLTQREALRSLGVTAERPAYGGDPREYLAALQAVGEAAELLDPHGLGGFTWLVQARGVPLPV
jgi:SAM-dependent MidA family methyltransferase